MIKWGRGEIVTESKCAFDVFGIERALLYNVFIRILFIVVKNWTRSECQMERWLDESWHLHAVVRCAAIKNHVEKKYLVIAKK